MGNFDNNWVADGNHDNMQATIVNLDYTGNKQAILIICG